MPLVNKNIDITNCMNILIVAYLIRRLHKVISYFRFSFIEMPSQIRTIDKEVIKDIRATIYGSEIKMRVRIFDLSKKYRTNIVI